MPKADETPRARADRKATGVVVALFLVLSAIFIVDSTWELAKGAFDLERAESTVDSKEAAACYAEVKRLEGALDDAVAESAKVKPEAAMAAYDASLKGAFADATMQELEASCRKVPRGMASLSSLLRVRRAEEAALSKRAGELQPLRDELHRALTR